MRFFSGFRKSKKNCYTKSIIDSTTCFASVLVLFYSVQFVHTYRVTPEVADGVFLNLDSDNFEFMHGLAIPGQKCIPVSEQRDAFLLAMKSIQPRNVNRRIIKLLKMICNEYLGYECNSRNVCECKGEDVTWEWGVRPHSCRTLVKRPCTAKDTADALPPCVVGASCIYVNSTELISLRLRTRLTPRRIRYRKPRSAESTTLDYFDNVTTTAGTVAPPTDPTNTPILRPGKSDTLGTLAPGTEAPGSSPLSSDNRPKPTPNYYCVCDNSFSHNPAACSDTKNSSWKCFNFCPEFLILTIVLILKTLCI